MKILVVSNLYPPHFIGGYELGCRDVVEGLRARGHTIRVLAGNFNNSSLPETDLEVARIFQYEAKGCRGASRHLREYLKLKSELRKFAPDLVYFWNLSGLSVWLPLTARWHGYRTCFYLSDGTFTSWRVGAWLQRWKGPSGLVSRVPGLGGLSTGWGVIHGQACQFCSKFLWRTAEQEQMGFCREHSIVAHWGIEPAQFAAQRIAGSDWPPVSLLYVGQLSPIKGVHTAIRALAILVQGGRTGMHLKIVGGGGNPVYEQELRELARDLGLTDKIEFAGKIPRVQLAQVYAESDILVLPSEWDEPFAITPLEAMAAGLAVVGTVTGGSGELLRDGDTAWTFQAGDPDDCARVIAVACRNRELFEAVRARGQLEVLEKHTLPLMLDKLENHLKGLSENRKPLNRGKEE